MSVSGVVVAPASPVMAVDFTATYKVLVIGDVNVGKTCLVHRFCDERYYDTYISTVGEYSVARFRHVCVALTTSYS